MLQSLEFSEIFQPLGEDARKGGRIAKQTSQVGERGAGDAGLLGRGLRGPESAVQVGSRHAPEPRHQNVEAESQHASRHQAQAPGDQGEEHQEGADHPHFHQAANGVSGPGHLAT